MEGIDIKFLRCPFGIDARDAQEADTPGHGELSVGDKVVDENGELVTLDESYFDASHPEKLENLLSQRGNTAKFESSNGDLKLLIKRAARFADASGFVLRNDPIADRIAADFFGASQPSAAPSAEPQAVEFIINIRNAEPDTLSRK